MSDGDPRFIVLVSSVWTQTLDSSRKASSLHSLSCKSEPACSQWTKPHPSRNLTMMGLTSFNGFYQTLGPYGYPYTLSRFQKMGADGSACCLVPPALKSEVQCRKQLSSFWAKVEPGILQLCLCCTCRSVAQAGFELGLCKVRWFAIHDIINLQFREMAQG